MPAIVSRLSNAFLHDDSRSGRGSDWRAVGSSLPSPSTTDPFRSIVTGVQLVAQIHVTLLVLHPTRCQHTFGGRTSHELNVCLSRVKGEVSREEDSRRHDRQSAAAKTPLFLAWHPASARTSKTLLSWGTRSYSETASFALFRQPTQLRTSPRTFTRRTPTQDGDGAHDAKEGRCSCRDGRY